MKKFYVLLAVLLLVSCEKQEFLDNPQAIADEKQTEARGKQFNDPALEASIAQIVQKDLEGKKWNNATVFVVETKSGRIKAHVSIERKENGIEPYTDTYDQEQATMETASTYLALLSTGKVTPETVFNTGNGIYGNIKDHNWQRGGYGNISLERALGVHSEVALTLAKEYAYLHNLAAFERTLSSYFGGEPKTALDILSFYNAVANDGCMVKLVSEEEDGIVLNEQIAPSEQIKSLQTSLERAVSQGILKPAGRPYTHVSACGRTIRLKEQTRRLELCGYFPSENPQYTIMVIVEKERLPASAGYTCGPIMSHTIDLLTEVNTQ